MTLNFYQLYNLLSENTVNQELKKFKQNKRFKEKGLFQNLIEGIKKIKFPYNTLINISENSKNIIANWILFHFFEFKQLNTSMLKWLDNATGKNDIRSAETYINSLSGDLVKTFHRGFRIEPYYDYIAANLDENGNLNQNLISKFNNPKFTLENLEELSYLYHEDLKRGKIRSSGREGKTILEFDDGYKWVDLERGYCDVEGRAGKHCGNVNVKEGDTILSLRDKKNYVHLTFILNNGVLEERKGYANNKPSEKLHPYIIELLKFPIIKHLGQGRYLPENDFQLTDLNEDQIKELLKLKPSFKNDYYRRLLISEKEIFAFSEGELFDYLWEKINNYPDFLSKVKHPSLLNKVFEKLSHKKLSGLELNILEYLAANNKTPGEVLSEIFKIKLLLGLNDNRALIRNYSTPPETLHKLAVICKKNWERVVNRLPRSYLDKIQGSLHAILPEGRVIDELIQNPNVSANTLEYLISIKDKSLSDKAKNKLWAFWYPSD